MTAPQVGEELGDFADPADILLAVGRRKAEILVQAVTDVIPIQHISELAALHEHMFQRECDRALAGSAQPGEPQRYAALLQKPGPLFLSDMPLVPGDVRRSNLGHTSPLQKVNAESFNPEPAARCRSPSPLAPG